ncbi:MAG: prepilin-type N-terminal cleavage/methylation domain-containing protein [Lachnospiraceae bacterium]|nr:prepilin-type N-terminal cleavage/methylation domain-containing protein [Lachnospiraceae bacterium]
MKNNKGYTLVETIVAVAVLLVVMAELGALMINSSQLYEKGTFEVALQEEAQAAMLQMEDLLMGATTEVTFDPKTYGSVSSNLITIKSGLVQYDPDSGLANGVTPVEYVIGLEFDVCAGTKPSPVGYGDNENDHSRLMMKRTVSGNTTYAVMAEGVRSLVVDVHEEPAEDGAVSGNSVIKGYKNADMVTLMVEMQNHEYHYSYMKDIYLRNQPGTGGPQPKGVTVGPSGTGLNVRRIHTYNVASVAPSPDYKYFKFADKTKYSSLYTLTGSHPSVGGTELTDVYINPTIQVTPGGDLGTDWDKSDYDCILICSTDPACETNTKEIKVYTEAVTMYDMPLYMRTISDSKPLRSIVPVTGICVCPGCMPKVEIEAQMYAEIPASWDGKAVDEYKTTFGSGFGYRSRTTYPKIQNIKVADYDFTNDKIVIPGQASDFRFKNSSASDIMMGYNGSLWFGCGGEYQFFRDTEFNNNNLVMSTTKNIYHDSTTEGAPSYWKDLVGKCNGYLRVRIRCYFKTGVVGGAAAFTERIVNMYYYPMSFNGFPDSTQESKLWTHINANYRTDTCE